MTSVPFPDSNRTPAPLAPPNCGGCWVSLTAPEISSARSVRLTFRLAGTLITAADVAVRVWQRIEPRVRQVRHAADGFDRQAVGDGREVLGVGSGRELDDVVRGRQADRLGQRAVIHAAGG